MTREKKKHLHVQHRFFFNKCRITVMEGWYKGERFAFKKMKIQNLQVTLTEVSKKSCVQVQRQLADFPLIPRTLFSAGINIDCVRLSSVVALIYFM